MYMPTCHWHHNQVSNQTIKILYTFGIQIVIHIHINFSTNNHLNIKICMSLDWSSQDLSNDTNYTKFGQLMIKLWPFLHFEQIRRSYTHFTMHLANLQNFWNFLHFYTFVTFTVVTWLIAFKKKSHVGNNPT
jgi:hypothetical protein